MQLYHTEMNISFKHCYFMSDGALFHGYWGTSFNHSTVNMSYSEYTKSLNTSLLEAIHLPFSL